MPRWHSLAAALVILSAAFSGPCAADTEAGNEPQIRNARAPRMIDLNVARPVQLALFSGTEIDQAATQLAAAVPDSGDREPVMALRVRNAPLSSAGLNDAQLGEIAVALRARRGEPVSRDDAAATFDRQMASLLEQVLDRAQRRIRLAVYGLPFEGRDVDARNRRFVDVLRAQDVIVSSRKVMSMDSGTTEWQMVSRALSHAIEARGDRAMYFQSNGEWRVVGGGPDDLSVDQTEHASRTADLNREPRSRSTRERATRNQDDGGGGGESNQQSGGDGDGDGEEGERPFSIHIALKGDLREQVNLRDFPVGSDVVLFYTYELGKHPLIRRDELLFGGVPQAMDMVAHLLAVRVDIERKIPDPEWAGYAVIDYEEFALFWEDVEDQYKELSRTIVRAQHASWTDEQIEAEAKSQFEAALQQLLVRTIRLCKELRPRATWGYFLDNMNFGPRTQLEEAAWLWSEVDALYPTCYIGRYGVTREDGIDNDSQGLAEMTQRRLSERVELCRQLAGPAKQVLPFSTWRYGDYNDHYANQPLNDLDLAIALSTGKGHGADGVILWVHINLQEQLEEFQHQLDTRIGPRMQEMVGGDI
jgi:hypothetical protein